MRNFIDLHKINKNNISYFKSSDIENTKKYFDGGIFEVLIIERDFFIKEPNTESFNKLKSSGSSNRGSMSKIQLKDLTHKYYNIFMMNGDLLVRLNEYGSEFNFLKKSDISDLDLDSTVEEFPDIYEISYCLKYKTETIIVTQNKHNFNYNNFRFYIYKDNTINRYDITNFIRYRDGGTTEITAIVDNKEYNLYYPSRLNKNSQPTLNDEILLQENNITEKIMLEKIEKYEK